MNASTDSSKKEEPPFLSEESVDATNETKKAKATAVRPRRRLNDLLEEGDKYQSKKMKRWKEAESALLIYKRLHGNLNVPSSFVVPLDDENWPTELWGKKLGNTVSIIRWKGSFSRYRKELIELGIKFARRRIKLSWPLVRLALETYLKLHYGNSRIPGDFIVPY
jgi:hypothetical protein